MPIRLFLIFNQLSLRWAEVSAEVINPLCKWSDPFDKSFNLSSQHLLFLLSSLTLKGFITRGRGDVRFSVWGLIQAPVLSKCLTLLSFYPLMHLKQTPDHTWHPGGFPCMFCPWIALSCPSTKWNFLFLHRRIWCVGHKIYEPPESIRNHK